MTIHQATRVAFVAGVATCALLGCESLRSKPGQGAAIGSAVGAATGAVVGHQYHETGIGMSVGSGLGGVAGSLVGSALEAQKNAAPQPAPAAPTKFCPIGGELYPEAVKYCPLHGVELRRRDAAGGGP